MEQPLHRISEVSGLMHGYQAEQLMSDPVLEDTHQTNIRKILTHNINLKQEDTYLSPRDGMGGEYIESNGTQQTAYRNY